MAARGVVALELVVYLRRCAQCLFKAVSPYQRRRSVHLVEIPDLIGNVDVRVLIVQFLLDQLVTENHAQLFCGHGFEGLGVKQGSRLVLHISPDIVPLLRHLAFFEIGLVGNVLIHNKTPF